ncbi:MAG TPA: hypothetical protein VJV39_27255 [Dongiaceae bacterium]|nr:hypothetical protein [Dongiaceae bacterium]
MIRRAALAIAMACTAAGAALPETLDEPTPPTQAWRGLNSDELWRFAHGETKYNLVDMETGQQGSILVGDGKISVSWYFQGEDDVAVLTRKGNSCIVIRRGKQPTKCISISEDPLSKSCRFSAREVRDKRTACLREATAP